MAGPMEFNDSAAHTDTLLSEAKVGPVTIGGLNFYAKSTNTATMLIAGAVLVAAVFFIRRR